MSEARLAVLAAAEVALDYPQVADMDAASAQGFDFVLAREQGALCLIQVGSKSQPLILDFVSGQLGYRLAQGRARQETLVRACRGSRAIEGATLLDATAGLGRDSALLAAAGFQVTALERHPVLAALLGDALVRAQALPWQPQLQLQQQDATVFLRASDVFDVIYLDPMFAADDSRAQVKKELAWLKQLLGPAAVAEEVQLLQLARQKVRRRVVVKRSAKAPPLAGVEPTASIDGKAVRFDIYTPA